MNAEMIAWAEKVLASTGEQSIKPPTDVRHMPWSQVISLTTKHDTYFLKAMAEPFAYEPLLLDYFKQMGFAHVPQLIAVNEKMHCFLMQDAGNNLREKLKSHYDMPLVTKALQDYAALQVDCIMHIKSLLGCGLADYRLERMPKLFDELLIQHRDIIIEDGLSLADLSSLQQSKTAFVALCRQLSALSIPATLEHGDFHDNNLLLKGNTITIHDFGDACITHPFFSIASFIHSAGRHHGLTKADCEQLLWHYLLPWQSFADQDKLSEAYTLAYRLRPFVWSLSYVRIYSCEGMAEFTAFKGYLADALKNLLVNLN